MEGTILYRRLTEDGDEQKKVDKETARHLQIAAGLLDIAANEFSNHTCNDLPDSIVSLLSEAEWKEVEKQIFPKEEPLGRPPNDHFLMEHLAKWLREEAKSKRHEEEHEECYDDGDLL